MIISCDAELERVIRQKAKNHRPREHYHRILPVYWHTLTLWKNACLLSAYQFAKKILCKSTNQETNVFLKNTLLFSSILVVWRRLLSLGFFDVSVVVRLSTCYFFITLKWHIESFGFLNRMQLPSLTLVLSGVFIAYICHSIWTIGSLYFPPTCAGSKNKNCIRSYLKTLPALQVYRI